MCLSAPKNVSPLPILKDREALLLEEIKAYLAAALPQEAALVEEQFRCLQGLGEAISQYPSVRAAEKLRLSGRDEESLISALSSFASPSHLFHIPTRVVAFRSFLVAKFNAFSFLSRLTQDKARFYRPLRQALFSIICVLMAEDVYFACLGNRMFSKESKAALAHDLLSLWDTGKEPDAVSHLPALEALWTARDETPPSFGTMEGSSELIRFSMDMEESWQGFLMSHSGHKETRWALEEFLFGLSYEEILTVRSWLIRFGISAVGRDEVRSYAGSRPAYGTVKAADPRAIYDFYIERRDAAQVRRRLLMPGPKRTLEELYLTYLVALDHGCPVSPPA
ncbi:MAG: hypothetical protein LBD13_07955 [Spirochaetaceae bacterium]|jgi:hypothetical protein|nr:hypothetical protein [Spirochaetaceae bacterium]